MADEDYKPYVGDEGTAIEIDMQEDLTSWTDLKFHVKKPKVGGGTEEKIVIALKKGAGDNEKQIMQYIIGSGAGESIVNFDILGTYYFQPYGKVGSWEGKGDTIKFKVYDKFK